MFRILSLSFPGPLAKGLGLHSVFDMSPREEFHGELNLQALSRRCELVLLAKR